MGLKNNTGLKTEKIRLNNILYSSENLNELKQISTELWQLEIVDFLEDWFNNNKYIEVNTSGSTGKPKCIRLLKTSMRNSAKMTNSFFELNNLSTALLCLPASYIAGKMMLVRAIVGEFNLLSVEPSANPFKNLNQKITFTAITPYQLSHSIQTISTKSIQNIIVGGSKINSEIESEIQHLRTVFFETYGMTETCSHIALRAINGNKKSEYFQALNGIEIRLNDLNCLCIKASHLVNKEITTTDIVEIHNNNQFKWIGRFDNTINTGGVKVLPETIEKKIEQLISEPYFISSLPDKLLGNKVILVIETTSKSTNDTEILNAKLKQVLSKFEVPKKIYYVPDFHYSAGNKVLKSETIKKIKLQE